MNNDLIEKYTSGDLERVREKVLAIEIAKIEPNPYQPRKAIVKEKIGELAKSIQNNGLIQPIVVRRVGNGYQIVVGERRYLACKQLGWKNISASVQTMSDQEMATVALIENIQREDLNYIEEAAGYLSLMKRLNLTQEELAKRLGKSQSTIANKLRLLKLNDTVKEEIMDKGLTERHARALLKLDTADQRDLIREIHDEKMTVSQTEKRVSQMLNKKGPQKRRNAAKPVIRDIRIVLNTIRQAVAMIQKTGYKPHVEEIIEDEYIEIKIRLNRNTK